MCVIITFMYVIFTLLFVTVALMYVTLCCSANYPCDMISVLHVVLYKTADPEHHVRERAAQLLHILDKSVVM